MKSRSRMVAPIFVVGFHRGGTKGIMNLIASHPVVLILPRETHEIFNCRNCETVEKWFHKP